MMFPLGLLIIGVVVILAFFGLFSKTLDILKIPRIVVIILGLAIIACYLLPDIRLGGNLRINIGGFIIPLIFSAFFIIACRSTSDLLYLFFSSAGGALFTLIIMRFVPFDTQAESLMLILLVSPLIALFSALLNKRAGIAVLSSFFAIINVQIYYSVAALFNNSFVTVTGTGVLFNMMIVSAALTAAVCVILQRFKSAKEAKIAQVRLNARMAEFGIIEYPDEKKQKTEEAQEKFNEYYGKEIEPHESNKPKD